MLIHKVQVRDTLAISSVVLEPTTPLTLIAGDNGAGKSSLCESIRLALLGELSRGLRHKKDMGALVRDGAKKGAIEITGEDWSTSTTLPAGAMKSAGHIPAQEFLECCLTPSAYANLSSNDRRAFTLSLLRVQMDAEAIAAKLLARDCHAGKVETLKPVIERRGYAAASEFAAEKASDARGTWKAHTGETYGSQKADGWLPTIPSVPEGTINGLQQQLDATDKQISDLNQAIGAANAHASTIDGLSRRIAESTETAKLFARRTSAVQAAEQALTEAREKLATAQEKASGGVVPQHWPCFNCGSLLMHRGAGDSALVPFEKPDVIADPQWRAALPSLLEAVTLMESALANANRDLQASSEAATLKASLEDQLAAVPKEGVSVDVGGMRKKIAELQDIRRTLATHQQRIRDAETARLGAEQTRDLAAKAHADVAQWVQIAELLQPDGIPGEILAEGIEPLNERLQWIASLTGGASESWPLVQIAPDMSVTYGGRTYALCSESERYRADVMLAIAIAELSGLRFVLLDRVDVLSSRGRVALFLLLAKMVEQAGGSPLQVIAAGTFKAPPRGLPASWSVHWMLHGGLVEPLNTQAQEAA